MKTHTGIVHGKVIELSESLGLPDGERVEVQVVSPSTASSRAGLSRCEGALADDWTEADDLILAELQRERSAADYRDPVQ